MRWVNEHRVEIIGFGVTILIIVLALLFAACGQAEKQDAKRTPHDRIDNSAPLRVINMPDDFPNVVLKCDGYGHMLYVVSRNAKNPAPVVVVPDERCPVTDR